MSDFLELEIFSSISQELLDLSEYIKSNSNVQIEISGPATLSGIIGLAFIESSLIERGYRYYRTFHETLDSGNDFLCIKVGEMLKKFEPMTVNLHMGHENSERTGVLDTVAQIGALALNLCPSGKTMKLEPWLIAGSWLRTTLDMVYNPIYTSIRDYLRSAGIISVVCIPEISNIDNIPVSEINIELLSEARNKWADLELKSKSKFMDELVTPLLVSGKMSVQRIEELFWNRIIVNGWKLDLASQCSMANRELSGSENVNLSASRMLDELIASGTLIH